MYVYREEGGLLSLLSGGRGMVKGGVGLSCLDPGKSLTLAGTSILRPSQHGNGTTAAPYRMRELAIPQAYVMRRGHKVFFTAAEDMVIGSKCDLIQRELQERERVCREVADVTMTTSRLNEKAVGYEETDERVRDTLPPGHYNQFYLDYLHKNKTHESDVFEGGISVDELNGGIRKDLPPSTNTDSGGRGVDSDSGIGASNVTSTDRLTPFSDMTMFSGGGGGASTTLLTPDKGKAELDFAMGACAVDKSSVVKGKKGSKAKKGKGKKAKKTKSDPKPEEPKPVVAKKKKVSTKGSKKAVAPDSTAATASRSSVAKKQGQATKKNSSSACQAGKASGRRPEGYSRISGLELEHEEERKRLMEEEAQWRKEQHNAAMRRDLSGLQVGQSISRPWTFSYFSYVPPPKVKESKKQKAGVRKS